jgi:addiction module RelE/StbE family toxin
MEFSLPQDLVKEIGRLKARQPELFAKTKKKLSLFKENPKQPSLRTHKLTGKLSNSWSISIEGNIRMLYYIKDGEAVFFTVGTHEHVYKK